MEKLKALKAAFLEFTFAAIGWEVPTPAEARAEVAYNVGHYRWECPGGSLRTPRESWARFAALQAVMAEDLDLVHFECSRALDGDRARITELTQIASAMGFDPRAVTWPRTPEDWPQHGIGARV